ncbi:MAG: LacI family DNA-binding transcriptional regulator [Clostridia bacterium]|nr:LacI family DNA-binding transcriptional regulator [Clostridia bacterium]
MGNKRVTIKDISTKLGVSYAIINRALNNKAGVSEEMKARILKTADELGYRVNKVAQSMARATLTIGVVIPSDWQEYYSVLRQGIDKEFDRLLDYNVESKYYIVDNIHSSRETVNTLKQCIEDGITGIILCDVFPTGLEKVMEELKSSNIPIVLIGGTQNIDAKCLCSVQVDAYRSGQMACEMMSFLTGSSEKEKDVVIFVGNKDNIEHRLKIDGFSDYAKNSNLNLIGIYETHDDDMIAHQLIKKIMGEVNDLDGIYLATANSASVCNVIENGGYNTKIISTDVYDKIAEYINKDVIQCTIFQDLERHGRSAVKALYEYIADQKEPEDKILITPQLIIKSNLDAYYK